MTKHLAYRACRFSGFCIRHWLLVIVIPGLTLIATLSTQAVYGQEATTQGTERKLEVAEKEWPKGILELVEVIGWQSPEFPKGFEIKIKNISSKPIYYCGMAVLFPDSKRFASAGSEGFGEYVSYGNKKLGSFANNTRPTADDVPINPGELFTLTLREESVRCFDNLFDPETKKQFMDEGLRQIRLVSQNLNFGDGTGFVTSQPYPRQLPQ